MLLREKDGFYAGKVREFPSHIGLELLRAGRAEDPFAETQPKLTAGDSNKRVPPVPILVPGIPSEDHRKSPKKGRSK
jgi:hypothetical protein